MAYTYRLPHRSVLLANTEFWSIMVKESEELHPSLDCLTFGMQQQVGFEPGMTLQDASSPPGPLDCDISLVLYLVDRWVNFILYFKNWVIYLKGIVKGRERGWTFICWFTPQISAAVVAGPGWSWEPRILFTSSTWVTGTQLLRPSSDAFPGTLTDNWIRSVAARTRIHVLKWNAATVAGLPHHHAGQDMCI